MGAAVLLHARGRAATAPSPQLWPLHAAPTVVLTDNATIGGRWRRRRRRQRQRLMADLIGIGGESVQRRLKEEDGGDVRPDGSSVAETSSVGISSAPKLHGDRPASEGTFLRRTPRRRRG